LITQEKIEKLEKYIDEVKEEAQEFVDRAKEGYEMNDYELLNVTINTTALANLEASRAIMVELLDFKNKGLRFIQGDKND
jgi:hypothetical protein